MSKNTRTIGYGGNDVVKPADELEEELADKLDIEINGPQRPLFSAEQPAHSQRASGGASDTREYTGGATSYYEIDIEYPHKADRTPYRAECLDIIEALGMSFAEGEAFKALWRKCAARQGKSKRGYNDAKYDAEKVVFYGQRILADVLTPKGKKA